MSGLIVCATQRSGSTLLCELLKATGVAGVPNEWFQHFKDTGLADQPRQYLAGLDDPIVDTLLPPLDPGTPKRSFDFEAVRRAGTTPNGVFAAKIMWSHTDDLWRRLQRPAARGRLRAAALRAGDPARQGRPGRVAVDGDPDAGVARRRPAATAEPVYSAAAIEHLVEWLKRGERAWTTWLARPRPRRRRLRGLRPRSVADDRDADRRAGPAGADASARPGARRLGERYHAEHAEAA